MGENAARNALERVEAFDRLKPIPANLNEPGMLASERVHLGEIVVIYGIGRRPGDPAAFRLIACRCPAASI
jgi:hypothetical protein